MAGDGSTTDSTTVAAAPDTSDLPVDTRSSLAQAFSGDAGFEALAQPSAPDTSSSGGGIGASDSSNSTGQPPRTVPNVQNGPQTGPQAPLQGLGGRLRGVLYGLATGGVPGAIGGAIAPNVAREGFQNRQNLARAKVQTAQSQAQFESVQAADAAVKASNTATQIDLMNQESRAQIRQMNDAHADFMFKTFGIQPDIVLEGNGQEVHDQATAALHTLAGENQGQIPPISALVHPHDGDNPQFKVGVYAPSQTDLQRNEQGFRNLVDTARTVQGLPAIDDLTWNSGGGNGYQGQRQMAQQAMQFLSPVQQFDDKDVAWKLAQRKQLLASYEQHTDGQGKPDADPGVVSALSKSVDFLSKAQDDITASKAREQSKLIESETAAKAAQEVAIRRATLPFDLAKTKAEEAVKDGDPQAAGQLLFNGDVAPSQIISSRKPAFAQAAFSAAKQLAQQQGSNWNAQAAEGYYNTAKSPTNLVFFGSAKSLTDQGGTLDQLQEAYDKLPNGRIPSLNKISDWVAAAAGSGATAEFATKALGVADDYSKVMGGGQGSDTSREQVLQSISRSSSGPGMAGALNGIRGSVDSQMRSRIGSNPVMKRMYGDGLLVHVKDPQGGDHIFRTQEQADTFKQRAGIQ